MAVGLSIVFGVLKLTNFAHGDVMMVGAFTTVILGVAGMPFALAMLCGIVAAALAGFVIERIAYRPIRNAPDVTRLLTSLAVTYILENLGILAFTSSPRRSSGTGRTAASIRVVAISRSAALSALSTTRFSSARSMR